MLKRKIPDALASICHYCSIRHYCLFLKDMGWKHTAYHIINSDPGHTRSKQQLDKTLKITFASLSRKSDQKEKKGKKTRSQWRLKSYLYYGNSSKCVIWGTVLDFFLFRRKIMFRSQDMQVFVFLVIRRFSKSVTSW